MSSRGTHRKHLKECLPEGWSLVGKLRNGHLRVRHDATGYTTQIASTPSDQRTAKNTRAGLRRKLRRWQDQPNRPEEEK